MSKIYKGIDVAQWNDVYDMKLARSSGVEFAIVKVINKQNVKEKMYNSHIAKCREAGIPIIAGYTYSYANTVAKALSAANAFVAVAKADIDVMILDLEDKSLMGLGRNIIDIINTYRKVAISARMGFIIYTGASYYNPCLKAYSSEIADIPIWWARYPYISQKAITDDIPDSKYLPKISNHIIGWQYSSKGVIPGINGYVDLNVWYENVDEFATEEESVIESNPYREPTQIIEYGSTGEDAMWVQWYLWRFGLLLTNGNPDCKKINGFIDEECSKAIGIAQERLGLFGKNVDNRVGPITRALFKKVC